MRYVLILLLAGCASNTKFWDKPGASSMEFEMDRGSCQAQGFSAPMGPMSMQSAMIFNACMRSRGWQLVEQ